MKVRTLNTFLFIFFLSFTRFFSQAPNWNWASTTSGAGDESGQAICSDSQGNSYVTGFYTGSSLTIGNNTFVNNGLYDYLLVKYDSQGNVVWSQAAGGSATDGGTGVCCDAAGNIYVCGSFYSSTMAVGGNTLVNSGLGDLLLMKYDASGNLIWTKTFGGSNDENGSGICSDAAGNIYVTGFFRSSTFEMGTFTLTNTGLKDSFLAKLDSNGNVIWARNFDCSNHDEGNCVTTDNAGNVLLSGYYKFASITLDNDVLNLSGATDIYVTKIDPSGNVIWSQGAGGSGYEYSHAIACDNNNNVMLTGDFMSADFAAGTLSLSTNGNYDVFVLKLNAGGNFQWAISEGSIFDDTGTGIVANGNSGFYLTGHFHSPSISIGTYTFSSNGEGDVYVAGFDQSGTNQWAVQLGGTTDDGSSAISFLQPNKLRVTGFYLSSQLTAGNFTLNNSGGGDMFCAELSWPLTAVTENTETAELLVYPNPASDYIQIKADFEIEKVEIWNIAGEKVAELKNSGKINLQAYQAGFYLIRFNSKNGAVYRKIQIIK